MRARSRVEFVVARREVILSGTEAYPEDVLKIGFRHLWLIDIHITIYYRQVGVYGARVCYTPDSYALKGGAIETAQSEAR